jgi:hypothetical protein
MLMVEAEGLDKIGHANSYPTLQGARFLVAIGILSGHLLHGYGLDYNPNQLTVDLFFFLEGFFATQIRTQDKSAWRSIVARFLRLYPLYMIGLLLGLVSVLPLVLRGQEGWTLAILPEAVLRGIFFIPSFLHVAFDTIFPLNPPSWAIIVEAFVFAGFCLLQGRSGIRGFFCISVTAGLIMLALIFVNHDKNMGWQIHLFWGGYPRAIFGFFGGVVLYRLTQGNYLKLPRLHPLVIWGAIIICIMVQILEFYFWLPALTVGLPLIILLGARSTEPRWWSIVGNASGRHAHALYLLSFPLQLILREVTRSIGLVDESMTNLFGYRLALAIVVAIVIITIVHFVVRYIDEPIHRVTGSYLARW